MADTFTSYSLSIRSSVIVLNALPAMLTKSNVCFILPAGHALRETSQFLADVFFERGPAPPTHFLDLSVGVPGQREGIGPATPEGVCVDAINWNSFGRRVVQHGSR